MHRNILAPVLAAYLLIAGSAPAFAASIEDGQAAYNTGDYKTALDIWRPLAEQGNARAQNNLGVMYENGKGVERDLSEAVKWWRKAARQGYPDAQYNLGAMYYNGRGVEKDYVRAYMWKSLAAEGSVTTVPQRRARAGRDAIGAVMSQAQLAQARAMIASCRASDFEDC